MKDLLPHLAEASRALCRDIEGLTDTACRAPSLLPSWSRGHVLTHLARNAEGGVRLLGWAQSGVPSYEYPSVEARTAAIEAGADRPAAELVADVTRTVAALAAAASALSPQAWDRPVTWTTGQQTPASHVIESRYAEVVLHHTDLDIGYSPASWPELLVTWMLPSVVRGLISRRLTPVSAMLDATDSGRSFLLGTDGPDVMKIQGTEAELLAWLMGRADGVAGLHLPAVPSVYHT